MSEDMVQQFYEAAEGDVDGLMESFAEGRQEDEEQRSERPAFRSVSFTDVETSNDGLSFAGYALIYDEVADIGDYTESVSRGAIRRSNIDGENIPMLWDHNPSLPPFATTGAGTLRLDLDNKGLRVEADLAENHFLTPTLRSMMERREVTGMSWGFVAGRGNSKISVRNGKPHRDLKGFKRVLDVSPTWDPAYEATSAELRSLRALQLAEDFGGVQQFLAGSYQQLEDGASHGDTDTGDSEQEEVRSGVTAEQAAAAARRRRLQMMGLSLPHEFRGN